MGSRLPRGTGLAAAFMGRASSLAAAPNSSNSAAALFPAGRGFGSTGWGFPTSGGSPSSNRFPIPPSPCSIWWEAPGVGTPSNWDPTRDKETHPPGGFMSYFPNQPHNFHLVGATMSTTVSNHNAESSPIDLENLSDHQHDGVDSDSENVRTEKRILWTIDEDEKLMSSWVENSTDSTQGADRGGNQYWGEVVDSYNKSIPLNRKRNAKQCKDRWHKINKWTDLFECAYLKAQRVFASGYSEDMWYDAAQTFYVEDNKKLKLGPFTLKKVWKACRGEPKWKTYNEELKKARKRKAHQLDQGEDTNDESSDEMPKRPIGQKAAKKASLAAKGKSKELGEDGISKESAIDVDGLDKLSKIQENVAANRMKALEIQQKLSAEKLESSRMAHITAQENREAKKLEKEAKMMEAYTTLISRDTSAMSDEEKDYEDI
ncbi:glutathione S-transferase T3-like [Setaria italica]|uniref:glutathione S-transferase T3-like n=1 Tax=Setaria italica TaxID=4555 RepID=UPI000BE61DD1|nr:glutathione S-transferase T3-like [Setaria italica]